VPIPSEAARWVYETLCGTQAGPVRIQVCRTSRHIRQSPAKLKQEVPPFSEQGRVNQGKDGGAYIPSTRTHTPPARREWDKEIQKPAYE